MTTTTGGPVGDTTQRAYTARELAEAWRVSIRHIYGLMERGELAYFQIGRSRRVLSQDARTYERENRHPGRGQT